MKLILILYAALGAVTADLIKIHVTRKMVVMAQPFIRKCEVESNSPPNAYKTMLSGTIEDDATLNFTFCYFKNRGYVDKDAQFITSSLYPYLKDDEAKEQLKNVMENCNKLNDINHMELLRKKAACVLKELWIVVDPK